MCPYEDEALGSGAGLWGGLYLIRDFAGQEVAVCAHELARGVGGVVEAQAGGMNPARQERHVRTLRWSWGLSMADKAPSMVGVQAGDGKGGLKRCAVRTEPGLVPRREG